MTLKTTTLKTILLLTREEEFPFLKGWLLAENAALDVIWAPTLPALESISGETFAQARLIAFVTAVVVPGAILRRLGFGAYNFHPGPPAYPGSAPATFAIYDGAREFGVTVHEMAERVDSGPIVDCATFPFEGDIALPALEEMAYTTLAGLFRKLAPLLVRPAALPPIAARWGNKRSTRRDYARLCEIPADADEAEFTRRLRALGAGTAEASPTLMLHGRRFKLAPPE